MKPIEEVKTKEEAREIAIKWHELEYLLTDVNSGYVVDPNLEEEEFINTGSKISIQTKRIPRCA